MNILPLLSPLEGLLVAGDTDCHFSVCVFMDTCFSSGGSGVTHWVSEGQVSCIISQAVKSTQNSQVPQDFSVNTKALSATTMYLMFYLSFVALSRWRHQTRA